ncbi:tyrosine-type recombinase/integrase [Nocardiopsis metallicus]|uniref:Integrase n=1 Tax=Nocardiopsis metallicus TaxID=179819 RepID=A0A840X006_9ACTN|nr:tyrosine-type recombinase/integrase [Nocardiopsis metallicus]MBB5495798.1 integrase [Nocardiopsis metallicus]
MSTELIPFPEHQDDGVVDAVVVDDDGQELEARTPDSELTPSAAARVADGWAASTQTGYARDWKRFSAWCSTAGRTPLPATPETLASYVDHLATAGLAPATIDRALGTIASYHEAEGHSLPTKAARMALRSYSRQWAKAGGRRRQAPALSVDQLRQMLEATSSGLVGLRNRALLLLGYTMMARRSELAALDIGDVREVADGLEVFVASSKTDKDSVGVTVAIPYGTHRLTCPVRTVADYLTALAEAGVTDGPLLRSVDRHGRPSGTPDAAGRSTGRMSGAGINLVVKELAVKCGVEGVTAHSLRAGPATAAAAAGVPRAWIARQGRWSERSTAIDAYIRPTDAWRDNPMRRVGL